MRLCQRTLSVTKKKLRSRLSFDSTYQNREALLELSCESGTLHHLAQAHDPLKHSLHRGRLEQETAAVLGLDFKECLAVLEVLGRLHLGRLRHVHHREGRAQVRVLPLHVGQLAGVVARIAEEETRRGAQRDAAAG